MTKYSAEYHRKYYLANRERILARTKLRALKWQRENPEEAARKNREYHLNNAEKVSARKRARHALTKEARRASRKRYHELNSDEHNAKARAYHAENRESILARHRAWSKTNPHMCVANVMKRKARKLLATPSWANDEAMLALYAEAARLSRETGTKHEVDHIVPLQGRTVCGLHCEANMEIKTASANRSKWNRWPWNQPAAVVLQNGS